MDEDTFNFSDYNSYGQSYAPGSVMDSFGFNDLPQNNATPVDFDNLPSFDSFDNQTNWANQSMPDSSLWGMGNNYGFTPDPNLPTNQFMPQSYGQSLGQSIAPESFMGNVQENSLSNGWNLGGIGNTLAQLFQGNSGKLIGSGIAAYLEGRGNKQMAQQIPQVVAQQQARQSPFDAAATAIDPTSGRAQAMEAYKAALANPYGNKIVSDQVEALSKAQAIKDAAAGRRSNNATSSPALVAAQAQIAQKYLDSMAQQAGAGINPNMGGLSDLVSALKYGANGYTSPFASAAGYSLGSNYTQNNQQNIIDALSKLMSK